MVRSRVWTYTAMTIPALDDTRILRHVTFPASLQGFPNMRLLVWDTCRTDRQGKAILGYAFWPGPSQDPLFSGEDFAASPMHAIDSDNVLFAVLSFLCLRPGDTDSEYFENYNSDQLLWAESYLCESTQCDVGIAEEEHRTDFFTEVES